MFKEIFIAFALVFSLEKSFATFGEDLPLLIEIVSNIASQLNELEKLVTNAEKYTQKMQEYNELMMDEYYKAQQIKYIVEDLIAKKEISNLESLNSAIYNLKYSMADLKSIMQSYGIVINDDIKTQKRIKIEKKVNKKLEVLASHQIKMTNKAKTVKRLNQIHTQNSSLMLKGQVKSLDHELEMIKLLSTNNRLLAEKLNEDKYRKIQKMKF